MIAEKKNWLILAIVSSGLFLVGIDMTVLNVALPVLAHKLGATESEKLWMVNAYSLVMAGLLPGCGTLSDRIGHRKMFVAGLIIFGTSSAIAAFAPTPALLIAARAALAVGAAIMLPATISIIRVVFINDHDRAIAIGIWGSVSAGASALGPVLGGFLLEHFWWGSVFLINVPIVILTLLFTFARIPSISGNPLQHWDSLTSALLTTALIALLYALKGLLKADINWAEVIAALIIGSVFIRTFARHQRQLPVPLIDFTLFRRVRFTIGTAGALFASFVMIGLQFVLSQELQLVRSFSPLEAGLFILPIAAGSFVAGPLLGTFLFRVGIERMLVLMFALAASGMVLFAFTYEQIAILWQITLLAVTGFGLGGVMSVASTAIMISAPEEKAGMAGAIEGISYELGGTLGVAVMGSVIASVYTRTFTPPAGIALPSSVRDNLDQAILAATRLTTPEADSVMTAGKTAFMSGVSITIAGGAILTIIMFVLMAFLTWDKRGNTESRKFM